MTLFFNSLKFIAKQKIANFVFERFNGNTGAAVFGSKSRVQLVYDTEYNWMAKKNAFVYRTNVTHRSLIKPIEKGIFYNIFVTYNKNLF